VTVIMVSLVVTQIGMQGNEREMGLLLNMI